MTPVTFVPMTALIGLPVAILTLWVWRVEGSRGLSDAHRAETEAKAMPAGGPA